MRLVDTNALSDLICRSLRRAIQDVIQNAPTIEAERIRHGHWEWNDYGGFGNYHCTVCRYIPYGKFSRKFRPDYMYCPRCGAKMDEVWEEPEINPCRGCTDYDGQGGCKSNGGCGAERDEVSE